MVGMANCYARSFVIAQAQMGPNLVFVIWNSGMSAVEGFQYIEVYGDMIWIFRIVLYIAGVRS